MYYVSARYFDWIYELVCDPIYTKKKSYHALLDFLHNTEFFYILERDENRAMDGIDFRYRFGYERNYGKETIKRYLDNRPCSVLEMMAALALRCDEHIMYDPEIGDRTSKWFFIMLESLGLADMDDDHFDRERVQSVIDIFLNRKYRSNGKGGLFTIRNPKVDLRTAEIWYQLCAYLNEL